MREYLPVSGTDADRAEAAALREALLPRSDASPSASGSKAKERGRGGSGTARAGMGGGEEEGSLNNMAGGADVEAGGTGGTALPLTPDGGSWAARRCAWAWCMQRRCSWRQGCSRAEVCSSRLLLPQKHRSECAVHCVLPACNKPAMQQVRWLALAKRTCHILHIRPARCSSLAR
jgi:hypothetical protein